MSEKYSQLARKRLLFDRISRCKPLLRREDLYEIEDHDDGFAGGAGIGIWCDVPRRRSRSDLHPRQALPDTEIVLRTS